MAQSPEFRGNAYRKLAELNTWTKQRHEAALEPELPILDPHHHLWDLEPGRGGRYLIHELVEDIGTGHNIVATVFIEVRAMYRADGPTPMQSVGEVEFANGVAAMSASGRYGASRLCAGIVGNADLRLGDQVKPVLEALIAAGNGRLRGIRHSMAWDTGNAQISKGKRAAPRHLALDPTFRQGFACLQQLGLSFDAGLYYPQLPELVDLLRAFPNANVILVHAGGPLGIPPHDKREEVFAIWRDHIRELAQFPNLSVKVGGLGMLNCGWDFHLRDAPPSSEELAAAWRPYVEVCIEAFGVSRCMMESNFPVDKQSCGYGVLWNALKRITQGCSAAEKAALYHDTAARIYRLAV
ncbi:MAG: amidohydrolase family protein [Betaproteobacteria bacterium]|nr:amidohydrolase family protein [Betaproteobacteria bacterium]